MKIKHLATGLLAFGIISCNQDKKETVENETYADVKVVGAMKEVMWNGELGSSIDLDTISDKTGLYGLGPESYLTGELLIMKGTAYVSKVTSDTSMSVEKNFETSAPFFVYANVKEWEELALPGSVKNIQELERFIDEKTTGFKRPFAFKLHGRAANAIIHILDLPEGTKVSSPDDAHRGQINYSLEDEDVNIVGFFSTEHKAVFTHHDSYVHMHLITEDESKMGHLDELEIGSMKLFLPKK